MRRGRLGLLAAATLLAGACGEERLEREALLDPQACQGCHPAAFEEWAGSMHAYASDDPVFLAMNARGQRETNGELGDFCVQCHAPMALREGATTDGLNLPTVEPKLKGVTCYFCHNVEAVEGTHNNPLVLANDDVMRGGIPDPADGAPHGAAYSELMDRAEPASSALCGSCHDVVTPAGFALERTFQEWQGSLFAHDTQAELQTCNRCHMPGSPGKVAEVPDAPERRRHSHAMPGVDVAMIDWPGKEEQRRLIQRDLDTTLFAVLCVNRVQGGIEIAVDLENFAAGHNFPSGATHDRRAWVEVTASLGGNTVFETGRVEPGQVVKDVAAQDPGFWFIGERAFKANGDVAHMFWDVRSSTTTALPVSTALGPWDPEYIDPHVIRRWRVDGVADRVEMKVHIRPFGLDTLQDLVGSGDLDPAFLERNPTFTLGSTEVVWTPDATDRNGDGCIPDI